MSYQKEKQKIILFIPFIPKVYLNQDVIEFGGLIPDTYKPLKSVGAIQKIY